MEFLNEYKQLIELVFNLILIPLFWTAFSTVKILYKLVLNDKIQDIRIDELERKCNLCPT